MGITYQHAGVDIDQADGLIGDYKSLAARTLHPWARAGIGGFASVCAIPPGMREPVIVSGADGVGTKLKVAFETGIHDTVGIDLVAMCVNDVITTGAKPIFFLDYFGTGKLAPDVARAVVRGIAHGCQQAGCALLGGETAELPGMYAEGEYDLAGFCVGVTEASELIQGQAVAAGDVIVGIESSGLHANGYSLARKVLLSKYTLAQIIDGQSLKQWLLTPTHIYASLIARIRDRAHALCHITGGGIVGNLPRVLPPGVRARIKPKAWPRPAIFDAIASAGPVESPEMWRVFNMGIGMIVVAASMDAESIIEEAASQTLRAWIIGEIEGTHHKGKAEVRFE